MKLPDFDYHSPTSLDEAIALMATPNARVLAGGQRVDGLIEVPPRRAGRQRRAQRPAGRGRGHRGIASEERKPMDVG